MAIARLKAEIKNVEVKMTKSLKKSWIRRYANA
jgi:hypothetical protein